MLADLFMTNQERRPVQLGTDPYRDIAEAVRSCESIGLNPVRLDADDWVTLTEAGWRAGVSRELLRQWAIGRHGPGNFPPPLNPERDTRFYSWFEISRWLRSNNRTEAGDGEEPILIAMNLAIQLRRLLPRLSRPEAVIELLRASGASNP